jgi:predicted metalloprotease with PDZ domain
LANAGQIWLGAPVSNEDGQVRIVGTATIGSPIYEAGIGNGGVIRTIDGVRATPARFEERVLAGRPGDRLLIAFELRGEETGTTLVLGEDPTLEVVTFEAAGRPVTESIREFRSRWLGSARR